MYKVEFYVPGSHLEKVKDAMFESGGGKLGNYDRCCWQIEGIGQFRPLEGSNPFSGTQDQTEQDSEWKVEMVCEDSCITAVIDALLKNHPYETPAYQYWKVEP